MALRRSRALVQAARLPASNATPANPSTITAKNGSWTNTATLTDIRLSLDAASPTALPVGGTAALYGLGTGS
jgi:hypothetical protein